MWLPILLATATFGCLVTAKPKGSIDQSIVGGEEVGIDKVPFQLSYEKYVEGEFRHNCGASIIGEYWALTAAHCIKSEDPSKNRLRAGTSLREKGGQLHQVLEIIPHEKYNPKTNDLDVALLKVDTSFNTSHIISLAKVRPAPGTNCSVSGWGTIAENAPLSEHLRWAFVPSLDQKECIAIYENEPITDNMICAGFPEGGKDACQADSGGPLVAEGTQVGIVSWGKRCAKEYPGVYVDVAAVREWIAEKTEQDVMS